MKQFWARYGKTLSRRTYACTKAACLLNALTGLGKLLLGILLPSFWLTATAAYYLILCLARQYALDTYTLANYTANLELRYTREIAFYRKSGRFLSLLGLCYLALCLRMVVTGDATEYTGSVLGIAVCISLSKIAFAISGIRAARRLQSPVVSTLKIFCLADACVSIVAALWALCCLWSSPAALAAVACLGILLSLTAIGTGLWMGRKKRLSAFQRQPVATLEKPLWRAKLPGATGVWRHSRPEI